MNATADTPREKRKPFWGKCPSCAHCWPVAYVPIEMHTMAALCKEALCPHCGTSKCIMVARQDDGVLLEQQEMWS